MFATSRPAQNRYNISQMHLFRKLQKYFEARPDKEDYHKKQGFELKTHSKGMCRALSSKWLSDKIQQREGFFDHLCQLSKCEFKQTIDSKDEEAFDALIVRLAKFSNEYYRLPTLIQQERSEEKRIEKQKPLNNFYHRSYFTKEQLSVFLNHLPEHSVSLIDVEGHIVGLQRQSEGEGFCYYDPNDKSGEVTFESVEALGDKIWTCNSNSRGAERTISFDVYDPESCEALKQYQQQDPNLHRLVKDPKFLEYAAIFGKLEYMELLLKHGANPCGQGNVAPSPMEYAQVHKHHQVAAMLQLYITNQKKTKQSPSRTKIPPGTLDTESKSGRSTSKQKSSHSCFSFLKFFMNLFCLSSSSKKTAAPKNRTTASAAGFFPPSQRKPLPPQRKPSSPDDYDYTVRPHSHILMSRM